MHKELTELKKGFVSWDGPTDRLFGTLANDRLSFGKVYVNRVDGTRCGPLEVSKLKKADDRELDLAFAAGRCFIPLSRCTK